MRTTQTNVLPLLTPENRIVQGRLSSALVSGDITTRVTPNEGILRSLQHAIILGLSTFVFILMFSGFMRTIWFDKEFAYIGVVGGWFAGMFVASRNGGIAYFQHLTLRFLLWYNTFAPLHYVRFLDYAAERLFLRKVGGGYIFTHRMLLEYFASLYPKKADHKGSCSNLHF